MPNRILFNIVLTLVLGSTALAQNRQRRASDYPPQLEGAKVEVYKQIGDVELNIYIYNPTDHKPSDERPVAVFFFGGGWKSGTPKQFEQHCKYLASRGMVAMTADYRVLSRHGTRAKDCVADAKSAIRWIRKNSERLGIDPNRLVAGGGSAGGHLAGCTGVLTGFEESGEDLEISSNPNAMALFNPALVLAPIEGEDPLPADTMPTLRERMGVNPRELSPYHHVQAGVPPTIIFHGKGDTTVPYRTVEQFTGAMKKFGNRCELVGYEDQPHGFFNHGRSGNKYFDATLASLDKFLVSLGYLQPNNSADPR
ncbi:MAG: alpha/beta hydrolase [Planctomycetaceae bacterium]|nr:alpha/beta hydrolase [Planctomycetales bacterium]MCB9920584.1 alpha/beta hydrolase [Planctomycetaceae bacterium]